MRTLPHSSLAAAQDEQRKRRALAEKTEKEERKAEEKSAHSASASRVFADWQQLEPELALFNARARVLAEQATVPVNLTVRHVGSCVFFSS